MIPGAGDSGRLSIYMYLSLYLYQLRQVAGKTIYYYALHTRVQMARCRASGLFFMMTKERKFPQLTKGGRWKAVGSETPSLTHWERKNITLASCTSRPVTKDDASYFVHTICTNHLGGEDFF
jgi:hypothetical protein